MVLDPKRDQGTDETLQDDLDAVDESGSIGAYDEA